ncbi:hypothetical protein yfred0001_30660 [Yersinia frederiksenii ATCC 33641]|nr:hypothetical protein yfred0001_30660 [Yersinia frederiksenii ATCC 33641]
MAALFYSGDWGAKRKYMRWLFALFIAVSCWVGSVSGSLLSPMHSPSPVTLFALDCHYSSHTSSSVNGFSSYLYLQKKSLYSQLRLMGVPVKKTAIKNRLGATNFSGSVNPSLANNNWLSNPYLAMSRSSRADEIYKQPRQSLPLLKYSNWIFHVSTQQNRVGGWKESNTQYSGMLTYHNLA